LPFHRDSPAGATYHSRVRTGAARDISWRSRPIQGVEAKRGSVVDPAVRNICSICQRAMNVDAFWKAAQQLLTAAVPNRLIGFMLQHNPIFAARSRDGQRQCPMVFSKQSRLKNHIATQRPQKDRVASAIFFPIETALTKSRLYRRYMAPQECAQAMCLLFRENQRLIARLPNAHGDPGRCLIGGNEIAPAALPAVFDCSSAPEVRWTRTCGTKWILKNA